VSPAELPDADGFDPRGLRCTVCGGTAFAQVDVLSPELVEQWGLNAAEARCINLQQGWHCTRCRSTLRCMAMARAVGAFVGRAGASDTLEELARAEPVRTMRILEINEAGGLHRTLAALPACTHVSYPQVDMTELPHPAGSFDLVLHSDTLEHIADPVRGLSECRRVLRDGGACIFTIPIVAGRLTRSRRGLPASRHGPDPGDTHLVHTEFGADAWRWVFAAGFAECRIVALFSPVAHALIGVRRDR
jgi:SAM-dependent methyltransferase